MTRVLSTLAIIFAAAIALGLLIHRMQERRTATADADEALGGDGLGGAVGFISGAAAFLLGILMLASLDHYNETKAIVGAEAVAYSAAFEASNGLAPTYQPKIQRDLICLMRSVATNSWAAASAGNLSGSDNTHALHRRASADADSAVPQSKAQENSLGILKDKLISASESGQQRLLAAESDLPLALWILVAVSLFMLTAILTALLRTHQSRVFAVTALVAYLAVSAAMVWTLVTFDEPFSRGDGVYIEPRALNAVMVRLQGTYPAADWSTCETLVNP